MRRVWTATLLAPLFIAGCSVVPIATEENKIIGEFEFSNGSQLQISKGVSLNEYRITAVDPDDSIWTSVGFYNSRCNCIEAIFQYDSPKEVYGDAVGVHRFIFRDGYQKVTKKGGWRELNEFPAQEYSRK